MVGVLSLHNSKETKTIPNVVDDLGYGTAWLRAENRGPRLEPDVDVAVNRLLLSKEEHLAESLELSSMAERLVPMLNRPPVTLTALHEFASSAALAHGLPDAARPGYPRTLPSRYPVAGRRRRGEPRRTG
jgi:hypothetical protein